MKRALVLIAALSLLAASPAGVTMVQQPDPVALIAGTQVLLQAGLDREAQNENGLAALVAETILQTPVKNGMSLYDAAAAAGGSVSYTIEPRQVRFYLEGTASAYPAVLDLFQSALSRPDFSTATVNAARAAVDRKIEQDDRLALNVGIEMLNRSFYANSDAGLPRYGIPETLAGFTAADARSFYGAHYRRGDAVVSSAGNIQPAAADLAGLVDALPQGSSPAAVVRAAALPSTSHQIIARRDVPVPWLVAQYHAPDIQSKDFGAMLVLVQFMERTLTDVSEAPSIATEPASQRGVGVFYNFDSSPANVIVYIDGGLGDPVRTFSVALGVVNVLGHAKLGGDLSQMKSYASGRLLQGMQTLQDRTLLNAVFAAHGIDGDAKAHLLKAIDSTTAADLQRVAAKYLGAPTIALVLPRAKQ